MQSALRRALSDMLVAATKSLDRPEEEHLFHRPMGHILACPDYKYKIMHPMDLDTVQRHCKTRYCSVEEWLLDMRLMTRNCAVYHGAGTRYDEYGRAVLRDAEALAASLTARFDALAAEPHNASTAEDLQERAEERVAGHVYHELLRQDTAAAARAQQLTPSLPLPPTAPAVPDAATAVDAVIRSISPAEEPPSKRRRVDPPPAQDHAAVRVDEVPAVLGWGVVTRRLQSQLLADRQHLMSLAASPPDAAVAAMMALDRPGWTVARAAAAFARAAARRGTLRADEVESVRFAAAWVVDVFEANLRAGHVLYPVERRVHEAFVARERVDEDAQRWADRYAVKYLVRVLAHLPNLLRKSAGVPLHRTKEILRVAQDLLLFLDANHERLSRPVALVPPA